MAQDIDDAWKEFKRKVSEPCSSFQRSQNEAAFSAEGPCEVKVEVEANQFNEEQEKC